jgi:AcrR family transcriptional regulator
MVRERATDTTALIHAAARVFNAKGYRNATIDDIAEAAGISRPTVYKYTSNKRALLDAMVTTLTGELGEQLQEALGSEAGPEQRLRDVVAVHIEAAANLPAFYAILFSEEAEFSGDARAIFRSWAHGVAVDFQSLLNECVAAGMYPSSLNTWIASNLMLSMLTSLYRWYDPQGSVKTSELNEQILALIQADMSTSQSVD